MERLRPVSWRAFLGVLALTVGALGDTCARRATSVPVAPTREASVAAAAPVPERPTEAPAAPTAAPATFEATVRPILAVKCAPCHNPGGKMYGRLPFDQPSVVSSHADGVRRRLKGEDLQAFERWLATLAPAPQS